MATQFLDIQIDGNSPAISKRAQNRVYRSVNAAAAKFWDRRYLRLHFLRSAKSRYSHSPRSRSTQERKLRGAKAGRVEDGGQTDNVHHGTFRRSANRIHAVRATPKFSSINIITPSYITLRSRKRTNPAKETLTIIAKEQQAINDVSRKENDRQTQFEIDNNRYSRKI